MKKESNGLLAQIIRATTKVEPNEFRATALSFLFVLSLMVAYFIIRPVRDAMASDWTRTETSALWTMTFLSSVIAVVIYGFVISRVKFSHVVPGVYIFFAVTFATFYFCSGMLADPTIIDKIFYVWLSVFSLFHISVFWSFMSGLFSKEQAPRLFALIASGASIGAIIGPSIPAFFADDIGTMNLMLVSAVILLVPVPIIGKLEKLKVTELGNLGLKSDLSEAKRLGRNPFSGFTLLFTNPYLLGIGLFILMYVTMSTFIYMEQREMLAAFDRPKRAQILGGIDLAVNSLAIVTALFVTNRFTTKFGMAVTLSIIPILMIGGWLMVAAVPLLFVVIGLQIARRAGNYAVTKPGREMLFTLVNDEVRYKTKPVIDIVVYRGGDMAMAWFHTALREVFALSLTGVAFVAALIAGIWAIAGIYLGRTYNQTLESE